MGEEPRLPAGRPDGGTRAGRPGRRAPRTVAARTSPSPRAGRRAIEEAAPAHVELVRQLLFDGLTNAQVRTLARVALSVLERLDDEGAAQPIRHQPARGEDTPDR